MDFRSLYRNIPYQEGIQAVKESLEKKPSTIANNVVVTSFTRILTLNKSIFNCIHYLQAKGSAMGTKCAPCYAIIFIGASEGKKMSYIYFFTQLEKVSNSSSTLIVFFLYGQRQKQNLRHS